MFYKSLTKIFIDTNIFLQLYHSNNDDSEKFMDILQKNKYALITTEQAYNEYLRNRTGAIKQGLNQFNTPTISSTPYIRSFPEYSDMFKHLKEAKNNQNAIRKKINEVLEDPSKDNVYNAFKELWDTRNTIPLNDEQIAKGIKRKKLGNPPGDVKVNSCGDEIIWEALVADSHYNLIMVSRDSTYEKNKEYLKYEYEKITGFKFEICNTVTSAFALLDISFDEDTIDAEYRIYNNFESLTEILYLKCKECECVFSVYPDYEDFSDERSMGTATQYIAEMSDNCPLCDNLYYVKLEAFEYPEGLLSNYDPVLDGVDLFKPREIHKDQKTIDYFNEYVF